MTEISEEYFSKIANDLFSEEDCQPDGDLPEEADVERNYFVIDLEGEDAQWDPRYVDNPEFAAGNLKMMIENGFVEDRETYDGMLQDLFELWKVHRDEFEEKEVDPLQYHLCRAMDKADEFDGE
ncbi:MAG: hypothetical protein ACLFS3_02555 [Candidatus Aenigmatarchaeota archaeon]